MTTTRSTPYGMSENAISINAAKSMICQWRSLRGDTPGPTAPDSMYIPLVDIQNIIALSTANGGTGVRAYFGISPDPEELRLLLVPCKDGEQDYIEPITGTELSTIYDLIKPCPPLCADPRSPLVDFTCEF